MNWTGGRLRRHSNQGNTQLSNRKQKFQQSKSRFKARANPPDLSLFTANTQHILRHKETQKEHDRVPIAPPCSTAPSPLKTTTPTDLLKQQLLQKSDWAAVSAARPLQISFAPAEETGRFGKRRRLTDSDRKRLRSHQSRPGETHVVWKSRQEDNLSDAGTINKLDIRFNGQRPHAGRMSSQLADKGLASSQPMLLDSGPLDTPPENDRNGQLWGDRPLSPFPGRESLRFDSPNLYSPSSRGTSPPIEEQVLPPRRHFTLDDQLIAEQEGRLNILHYSHPPTEDLHHVDNYHYSPPQETEANRQDQTTGDTQSFSGNHWLPNPRCTIQRALRSKAPLSTPSTTRSTLYDPALQANPTPTTTNQQVSPPTIYGQPIISLDQVTARNTSPLPWILSSPNLSSHARRQKQHDTGKDYPSACIASTESIPRASSPQSVNELDFFFSRGDILPNAHLPNSLHVLPRTTTIAANNSNDHPWMLSWPTRR
ncbi:uncharacterized protein BDW47DRAFT_100638 [Aspergillus candidus]|uniref:Uncharacterized protein n=1 Tax=Aspergillus candidus TaxID=41067 RepID=A0A2I2FJ66_ASPCN|nr:hypothetical protein BDW47DRAFT_100638 [Aspergillus candidus]PLB40678.1 hypothetical protein BDW47DRAFT_100638 [Aspergillus candidus]